MTRLSTEEREILEATRFAQKALMQLLAATIDLAVATGGRAETKADRAAYQTLQRIVAGIGGVLHAAGDLVRGEGGGKADPDLWQIHDANLKRQAVLAALGIDAIGNVGFAERPAAKDFESHYVGLKAAEWCAADLGLDGVPVVRWFAVAGYGEAKAFEAGPATTGSTTGDGEIWIRDDLDVQHVIKTIAHECRHLAQGKADLTEFVEPYSTRPLEVDAREYAHVTMLRLHGPFGHGSQMWREQARQARAGGAYSPPMRPA